MARKSETPATKILNLLIGLAVLTMVVAALLLPLYLIYQTVAESLPVRRIRRTLRGDATDFWLDEEESKSFKEGSVRMDELRRKIRLEEERAHENDIGRNNDGSFTRRSYLGKEIQENIEFYESQREELSSAIRSLRFQPFHRWEEFNSLVKNQFKASTALKAWFAVMICGLPG